MPSKNRQLNMRPDEATWAVIARAKAAAEAAIGLELSYADLVKLAMLALEEKHAPRDGKAGSKK